MRLAILLLKCMPAAYLLQYLGMNDLTELPQRLSSLCNRHVTVKQLHEHKIDDWAQSKLMRTDNTSSWKKI